MLASNILLLSFILYLFIIIVSTASIKKSNSISTYIFASRKLTTPALIASIVSTWYGGILAIGEFVVNNGVVTWLVFGVPYYFAALIYALFLTEKIHDGNSISIPEKISSYFGQNTRSITALLILFIASPAPYIYILSVILNYFLNTNIILSLIISSLFTYIYIYRGGLASVIATDIIQFCLIYLGFGLVFIYLYINEGDISYIFSKLPNSKLLSVPGNLSWSYIFSWFFIGLVTFIDPSFFQRTYSATNKSSIKKSIFYSIFFWIIFDFLTIITAIYIIAIIPNLNTNPYLALLDSNLIPNYIKIVFFFAIISVVMSTIDSYTLISGFTISADLLGKNDLLSIKISMLLSIVFSFIIALFFNSAINIWYVCGSFGVSALLLPLIISSFKFKTVTIPRSFIIIPAIITMLWFLYGMYNGINGYPLYPFNIEPMYPGLASSYSLYIIFKKNTKYLQH